MARRLPVIQSEESEDALAASRPRLHWVLIGAGLAITLWAPLALLTTPLGARVAAHAAGVPVSNLAGGTTAVPHGDRARFAILAATPVVLAFFIGSLLAGVLVGRFGGRAGPREAALGGACAALVTSLLGLRPGLGLPVAGIFAVFAVLSLFGVVGGALGGYWGRRSRH